MITKLNLSGLSGLENISNRSKEIRDMILLSFPAPLQKSYEMFLEFEKTDNKDAAIGSFARNIVTNFFQFISLVLVSEYIRDDSPKTRDLYVKVENMIYRPGPGKYLDFCRALVKHYKSNSTGATNQFVKLLEVIEELELKRKKPLIELEENNNSDNIKKLGVLEFLVKFRNSFAHSKSFDKSMTDNLYKSLNLLILYLFNKFSFISKYSITTESIDLAKMNQGSTKELKSDLRTFINFNDQKIELFPLLFMNVNPKSKDQDVFLLDEIAPKKVYYSSTNRIVEKSIEKDALAQLTKDHLAHIDVEPETLDLTNIDYQRLLARCNNLTSNTLNQYAENKKYIEDCFIYTDDNRNIIESFFNSRKELLLVEGEQGCGKSALLAHIAKNHLANKSQSICIFIDAREFEGIEEIDLLNSYLEKRLELGDSFKNLFQNCLKSMKDENYEIFVFIDNINEYYQNKEAINGKLKILKSAVEFMESLSKIENVNINVILSSRINSFLDDLNSIGKIYGLSLKSNVFSQEDSYVIQLNKPSIIEAGLLYNRYRENYTNHEPISEWKDLSPDIQQICENPLLLQIILQLYDGQIIPKRLTEKSLKKQFSQNLMDDKSQLMVILSLLKEMKRCGRPFLLKSELKKDIYDQLFLDRFTSTSNSQYEKYRLLVESHIIREEIYQKENLVDIKISFTNEMVLEILSLDEKKMRKRIRKRANFYMIGGVVVILSIIFSLFTVSLTKMYKDTFNSTVEAWVSELSDKISNTEIIPPLIETALLPGLTLIKVLMADGIILSFIVFLVFFLLINLKFFNSSPDQYHKLYSFDVYEKFFADSISREQSKKVLNKLYILSIPGIVLLLIWAWMNQKDDNTAMAFFNISIAYFVVLFLFLFFSIHIVTYRYTLKTKSKIYLVWRAGIQQIKTVTKLSGGFAFIIAILILTFYFSSSVILTKVNKLLITQGDKIVIENFENINQILKEEDREIISEMEYPIIIEMLGNDFVSINSHVDYNNLTNSISNYIEQNYVKLGVWTLGGSFIFWLLSGLPMILMRRKLLNILNKQKNIFG